MRSTISSRGQTAVPAAIRRRFNLADRSRLEWMADHTAEVGVFSVVTVIAAR